MLKLLLEGLRPPATIDGPRPDHAALEDLAARLDTAVRGRLGRSLSIRAVDAGSCNGCELEMQMLNSAA